MKPLKIFLYNCAHCRGYNGSPLDYLAGWARFCVAPKKVDREVSQQIIRTIEEVKPDVCFFNELRENSYLIPLLKDLYKYFDVQGKYGSSYMNYLPGSQGRCNGFFSNQDLHFQRHFFANGTKRLFYEVKLTPNTKALFAHFALGKGTRRKQFEQLIPYIECNSSTIVCGDFNVLNGLTEVEPLIESCNLCLMNEPQHKTFPAYSPKKVLDLFLSSPDVRVNQLKVITSLKVSDHLPVLLECQVP